MNEYCFPKSVIASRGVVADPLLIRQPLQVGLREEQITAFAKGDYVILDFGVELCGGVRILTHLGKNVPVRIRFGESMSECCSDLGGKQNATNDHSLRDFTVLLQDYSDMTFGNTGFRFVRLDFSGRVKLKSALPMID